jgi:transketolase
MAEQNMMSFAGGLGLRGSGPFLHSFGVFLYRRPYDQLMASVAYPRRKVRLMGFLPGVTTPGGMTHQAIEDIAVMRTIPNMTVLEAGTPPRSRASWPRPTAWTGRSTAASCAAPSLGFRHAA